MEAEVVEAVVVGDTTSGVRRRWTTASINRALLRCRGTRDIYVIIGRHSVIWSLVHGHHHHHPACQLAARTTEDFVVATRWVVTTCLITLQQRWSCVFSSVAWSSRWSLLDSALTRATVGTTREMMMVEEGCHVQQREVRDCVCSSYFCLFYGREL